MASALADLFSGFKAVQNLARFCCSRVRWVCLLVLPMVTACSTQKTADPGIDAFREFANQGDAHDQAGDFEAAIVAYTNALNYHSESAETYYRRGLAQMNNGFPDTAIYDFDAAIRRRPGHAETFRARAEAYLALKRHNSAIRDSTEAIRLRTGYAAAHYCRGQAYLGNRDYQRAIADLREAMQLDEGLTDEVHPLLGIAYFERSQELAARGNADESDAARQQAVLFNSEYVAKFTPSEARLPENTAVADTAPSLDPDNTVTALKPIQREELYEDGVKHLDAEKFDEAILCFTSVLRESPRDVAAYLGRGTAFYEKGFPDTALGDLERAILYDRTNAAAYCQRARAHSSLGNDVLAIRDCTDAIRWDASLGEAYRIRALSYIRDGQLERAESDLREAKRLAVSDTEELFEMLAEAYLERGLRHVSMRALDKAVAHWQRLEKLDTALAAELRGPLAQAFYDRAQRLMERSELEQASADLALLGPLKPSLARELKSRLARAYQQRGEDQRGAGDEEAADRDFRRAQELGYRES
jgi:tetratricopeptide (TPR) repeat protein